MNICIGAMICVVGLVAFLGGFGVLSTSTVSGVYYNGDKNSKNVTLMINVYWGTEFLDDMLKVLEEKNVKTTFFIGGTWVALNESMLQKIHDQGHEIANHGYKHKDHDKLSEQDNYNEISSTHKVVKGLLDVDMNLFAPPSGAYNSVTVDVASQLGYKTIMWTRDTIDWRDHDTNIIYTRAIKKAAGGDLILMHPTKNTLAALPRIIDWFQSNDFNLTTVSNNIGQVTT